MYLPTGFSQRGLGSIAPADVIAGAARWRGVTSPTTFFTKDLPGYAKELPGELKTDPGKVIGFVAVPLVAYMALTSFGSLFGRRRRR